MTLIYTPSREKCTSTALILPEDLTTAEFQDIAGNLVRNQRALQWHVGDLCVYGEKRWGKTYEQMQTLLGMEYNTLANWAYTAKNVPFSRRREKLSWAIHREVAPLSETDQERWLYEAEAGQMTVAEIRVAIARERERANPKPSTPSPTLPVTRGETIGQGLEVGPRNETMIAAARRGMEQSRQENANVDRPATRVEVRDAAQQVCAAVAEAGQNAVMAERGLVAYQNETPGQPLTLTLAPQSADALRELVASWNVKNPHIPHTLDSYVVGLVERETYRRREG